MRTRTAALSIVAMIGAATGASAFTPSVSGREQQQQYGAFCGPRCVKYLIIHYGQDCDLLDVIREAQWPDSERGATLAAIEAALSRRRIGTCGVAIPFEADITWPHPVLVHLLHENGEGHFVVWLEQLGRTSRVWDGLRGESEVDNELLAQSRSGTVLLTAPGPITSPAGCTRSGMRGTHMAVAVLAATSSVGVLVVLFARYRSLRRARATLAQRGASEDVSVVTI